MRRNVRYRTGMSCAVALSTVMLFSATLHAKGEPKTYPESGKVIAAGLNEHTKSHPTWGDPNGGAVHGGGSYSAYSHTYKVETETKIYELDCGKTAMFHSTGKACGGDKGLQIGDVIHFRTEKESFYIPLPDGSEQKLRILQEELRRDTQSPSTTDAKQEAKQ